MKKVRKLIEKFDYWSAIEYMEREISEGKEKGDFFLELGHLYRGVGEIKKAREYYSKGVKAGVEEAKDYEELTNYLLEENNSNGGKNEIQKH